MHPYFPWNSSTGIPYQNIASCSAYSTLIPCTWDILDNGSIILILVSTWKIWINFLAPAFWGSRSFCYGHVGSEIVDRNLCLFTFKAIHPSNNLFKKSKLHFYFCYNANYYIFYFIFENRLLEKH